MIHPASLEAERCRGSSTPGGPDVGARAITTSRLLKTNPEAVASGDLDDERARKIAEACIQQAAIIPDMRTADCGREDLPLFVAGRLDYPDATDHIARGLAYNPSWWKLRHYERPDSERSWKDGYPETDDPDATPPCIGSGTLPDPTATACDEYPFLKTEQGATANSNGVPHLPFSPLPHLKIIDASQNSGSGSRLSGFVLRCKMQLRRDSPDARYGYGHFLVVPVQDVPTYGFCNGQNPPG